MHRIVGLGRVVVRHVVCFIVALVLISAAVQATFALPITVETQFALPDSPDHLDGVWLAGFSQHEGGPPTALSVSLAVKQGWFPVWSFQLQTDQDLLPAHLNPVRGSGALSGSHTFTLPLQQGPRWGHEYETALSYDGQTGALSVWIYDVTDDKPVYAGGYRLNPWEGPMHAGAGTRDKSGIYSPVPVNNVTDVFIPMGVQWYVTDIDNGQPGTAKLTRIDRGRVNDVGVAIAVPAPLAGAFQLSLENSTGVHHVRTIAQPQDNTHVPIPTELLRLGTGTLRLQYVDEEGKTRFSHRHDLTVGQVATAFDHVVYKRDEGVAAGAVTVRADAPSTAALHIKAMLTEMVWDGAAQTYTTGVVKEYTLIDDALLLTAEPTVHPFTIPLHDDEAAFWQVEFVVETDEGVTVMSEGAKRYLATYTPAAGVEEGPFTIVVLPDTQYMTHFSPQGGRPEMFTRMTHWIAEQAETRNIGLVLHVGDITDQNARPQWQVAQNSMYLLHGIVPYALAAGNHDIGPGGNASNRQTYLNEYFPFEEVASAVVRGDTFEPGRMENSYQRFRLGGRNYLVISLEFLPRDEVLHWANDVAAAHPDHRVIVVTHTYTSVAGTQRTIYGDRYGIVQNEQETVNTGLDIWNKFVRKHPNMFLVLSGHVTPDAVLPRQIAVGDHGNRVYELLVNFQHRPQGGAGWLGLLEFDPPTERIGVQLYSPFVGEYRLDPIDLHGVPFCIDAEAGHFVRSFEGCHLLPDPLHGVTTW